MTRGPINSGQARSGPANRRVYPTTAGADMAAFDALPRRVRERVAIMPISVAAAPLLAVWLSGAGDCVSREAALLAQLDAAAAAMGRAA